MKRIQQEEGAEQCQAHMGGGAPADGATQTEMSLIWPVKLMKSSCTSLPKRLITEYKASKSLGTTKINQTKCKPPPEQQLKDAISHLESSFTNKDNARH